MRWVSCRSRTPGSTTGSSSTPAPTRFALHAIPAHFGATASPTPRETAGCKLILAVDDLAAARERLTAAGATILDRPWGGWDFADPEGNVIGVRT